MDITTLVSQLAALAGVGALIALLVNIGKKTGLVKDGQAQNYSAGLNVLALAGLFALKVFRPEMDVNELNSVAAKVAEAGVIVFGLVVQMYGAKWAHGAVRGVPFVGQSFSA